MSLIYWWPFTDNTVDKINGKTFTSTNWSFQSGGKIGNCFTPSWTDSDTITRQIYAENVSIPETFSVAVWVKNNNNFNSPRTYCPIQFSDGDCWLTGAVNKGWDFSHSSLRLIFNNGSNVSGNARNGEVYWGYNPSKFLGNWYHIAFTVNKTTRKAELFINGISEGIKDLPSAVDTYGGTFKLKLNWVQGWMLDGSLNDLRIYSHALSKKEVRKLSRGLVLHYTFDAPPHEQELVGAGVNRWTDINYYEYDGSGAAAGSYSLQSDGSVLCEDNNSNSRFRYKIEPPMKQGDTFELSIRYKQLTGEQAFRWQVEEVSSSNTVTKQWWSVGQSEVQQEFLEADGWKLIKYVFTVSNAATTTARFWIQGGQDYIAYTRSFQLKDFKIHKLANKIHDSSGLGNDGTLVLPQYYSFTNDTILGTKALHSRGDDNGRAYIDTTLNPSFINGNGTICFWYKKDSGSTNFLVATPRQTSNGKYLWANKPGATPWNSGAGYSSWYIDGVEQKNVAEANTDWHFYCITGVDLSTWSTFTMHCHSDGAWLYRGKIADFKVYNTILSGDDIRELYNVRWAANKQAQIFSNAINEGQSAYQITRSGIVNCNELNEIPTLPAGYVAIESAATNTVIDTGVVADQNTEIDIIFTPTVYENGKAHIYGGAGSGYNDRAFECYYWSGFQFNYNSDSVFLTPPSGSPVTTRIVKRKEEILLTQNGTTVVGKNITSTFTAPCTIGFGGLRRTTGDLLSGAAVYFHRVIIRNNGQLQRYYLPCNYNNTSGFYEFVTGTFVSNGEAATRNGVSPVDNLSIDEFNDIYCNEFNEI